jgi:hypothetical protein
MVCEDLVKELDEHQGKLQGAEMKAVAELVWLTLYKATSQGGQTGSLSVAQVVSRVPEMAATQRLRGGGSPFQEKKKEKKADRRRQGKEKDAGKEPPVTPPTIKRARTRSPGDPYEDKAGEMGPNELPRKKGGNPAGRRCRALDAGGCKFGTCSFSHA